MDISALAAEATSCLTPALPFLMKAGEKGIETIGGKMGVGVWETAKALWQRLSSIPSVELAAREVASTPEDEDAQAAYRVIEDAFNEWPDREPSTFEEWAEHGIAHGSFAPHLSRLAFDGDELVGTALSIDYASADEGWIQQVATKATHRHRGIARGRVGA